MAGRGTFSSPPVALRKEVANSVTHGLSLLASIAGAIVLIGLGAEWGEGWHVVSAAVYGATLVALMRHRRCTIAQGDEGEGRFIGSLLKALEKIPGLR